MLTPLLQLHISVEYRTHVDIYLFLVDIFQRIDLGRYVDIRSKKELDFQYEWRGTNRRLPP